MAEEAWFQDVADSITVGESLLQMHLPPLTRDSHFYQYNISFTPLFLLVKEGDAELHHRTHNAQVHISIVSRPDNVIGEPAINFEDVLFLGETRLKQLLQLITDLRREARTLTDFINAIFLLTQKGVYSGEASALLELHQGADVDVPLKKVEIHNHNAYVSLQRHREIAHMLQNRSKQNEELHSGLALAIDQVLSKYHYTGANLPLETSLVVRHETEVINSFQDAIIATYLQQSKNNPSGRKFAPGMRITIDVIRTDVELLKDIVGTPALDYAQLTASQTTGTNGASSAITPGRNNHTSEVINIVESTNLAMDTTAIKVGEAPIAEESVLGQLFSHQERIHTQATEMFALTALLSLYFLVMLSLQKNIRGSESTGRFYDLFTVFIQEDCDVRPWIHVYSRLYLFPPLQDGVLDRWLKAANDTPVTLRQLREELVRRIDSIYHTESMHTFGEFLRTVQRAPAAIENQAIFEQYQNNNCLSRAMTSPEGVTVGIKRPDTIETKIGLDERMAAALHIFYILIKDPFDSETGLIDPFSVNGYLQAEKSIYLKDFIELYKLGKGGYGEVVCATKVMENQKYAVKKVIISRNSFRMHGGSADDVMVYLKAITNEIKILSRLSHPYIVKYYYSWIEPVIDATDYDTAPISQICSQTTVKDTNTTDADDSSGNVYDGPDYETPSESSITAHTTLTQASELMTTNTTIFKDSTCRKAKSEGANAEDADRITKAIIFVQMEYCAHGSLATFIERCSAGKFDMHRIPQGLTYAELLWRMTAQVIAALAHIHSQNIVHYDIKPANILLDEEYNVKLGDFGTSYICMGPNDENDLFASDRSTVFYMAPELSAQHWMQSSLEDASQLNFSTTDLRKQADVYSLGVTLLELWFLPSTSDAMSDLRTLAQNKQLPEEFTMTHPNITAIIYQMCDIHPMKRPTAFALIETLYSLKLSVIADVLKSANCGLKNPLKNQALSAMELFAKGDEQFRQAYERRLLMFMIRNAYIAWFKMNSSVEHNRVRCVSPGGQLSMLANTDKHGGVPKSNEQTIAGIKASLTLKAMRSCDKVDNIYASPAQSSETMSYTDLSPQQYLALQSQIFQLDTSIECVLRMVGASPIVLPTVVPLAALRKDVQRYAALVNARIYLASQLSPAMLTEFELDVKALNKGQCGTCEGSVVGQSSPFDLEFSSVDVLTSTLETEMTFLNLDTSSQHSSDDQCTAAYTGSAHQLLLDLTANVSLSFLAYMQTEYSLFGIENPTCIGHSTMHPNMNDHTDHSDYMVDGNWPPLYPGCHFTRHNRSGVDYLSIFKEVLSSSVTRDESRVAGDRLRTMDWALTVLRIVVDIVDQNISSSSSSKKAGIKRIERISDALSIDITVRFVKGAPLNSEMLRIIGRLPDTNKTYTLSSIDNIVFFQNLETVNSCSVVATAIMLLKYLKNSPFADKIRISFIPADDYSVGANSIVFVSYIRESGHVRTSSSGKLQNMAGQTRRRDDTGSRKRPFVFADVSGYPSSAVGGANSSHHFSVDIFFSGSFVVTNPPKSMLKLAQIEGLFPHDFFLLNISTRAIQKLLQCSSSRRDRACLLTVPYSPIGLTAHVQPRYTEAKSLEGKIQILNNTIYIQKLLLLTGFCVESRVNQNDALPQSAYRIGLFVDSLKFEVVCPDEKGMRYVIDWSLCSELNAADSISRFLIQIEERLLAASY